VFLSLAFTEVEGSLEEMRIALNARVLATEELRGWSRYAVNLLEGLLKAEHEVFLFSDKPINQKLIPHSDTFCQVTIKSGRNYFDWEQRVLPQLCAEHKIDILHCPINFGLPLFCRAKKVLTLHDAIEKAFYDRIITVSEHAKQDIINFYGVAKNKIEVIYEGADPDFQDKNVQDFVFLKKSISGIRQPYFFYVGGLEERKNIDFLIKAWAQAQMSDYQLVIGGGTPKEIEKHKAFAEVLKTDILFTGYIPQNLLPSFFAQAHCFIYPSLYEGFGLQIVESLQMGTPVICSNVTSLPEILGDDECTFDPQDVSALADLINKMSDIRFYQEKKKTALRRREDFSWSKAIALTLDLYKKLLSR
jgi:glycosyltransferase involved in cell wall biosynthesis